MEKGRWRRGDGEGEMAIEDWRYLSRWRALMVISCSFTYIK